MELSVLNKLPCIYRKKLTFASTANVFKKCNIEEQKKDVLLLPLQCNGDFCVYSCNFMSRKLDRERDR